MAPDNPERDPFLAAVEAKIAAWTAVADSYRAAVSIDGPVAENTGVLRATLGPLTLKAQGTVQLPIGVFRDKSLKEAIPVYLEAGRRTQTNKEIATGLQAGGFPTTAGNFEATVATALYRLKKDGIVLRFPDGWDVASSYPDSLRNRLEKDAKPRPKQKNAQRGKAKRPRKMKNARKAVAKPQPDKASDEAHMKTIQRHAIRIRPDEEVAS